MIIFFIHRRDFLYCNVRTCLYVFQTFCAGCGGCQAHCFEEESPPTQQFLARLCALTWSDRRRLWRKKTGNLTGNAPKNRLAPKRKLIFQPSFFRGELLNFGDVSDSLTETWSMTYIAGGFLQMSLFKKYSKSSWVPWSYAITGKYVFFIDCNHNK